MSKRKILLFILVAIALCILVPYAVMDDWRPAMKAAFNSAWISIAGFGSGFVKMIGDSPFWQSVIMPNAVPVIAIYSLALAIFFTVNGWLLKGLWNRVLGKKHAEQVTESGIYPTMPQPISAPAPRAADMMPGTIPAGPPAPPKEQ